MTLEKIVNRGLIYLTAAVTSLYALFSPSELYAQNTNKSRFYFDISGGVTTLKDKAFKQFGGAPQDITFRFSLGGVYEALGYGFFIDHFSKEGNFFESGSNGFFSQSYSREEIALEDTYFGGGVKLIAPPNAKVRPFVGVGYGVHSINTNMRFRSSRVRFLSGDFTISNEKSLITTLGYELNAGLLIPLSNTGWNMGVEVIAAKGNNKDENSKLVESYKILFLLRGEF